MLISIFKIQLSDDFKNQNITLMMENTEMQLKTECNIKKRYVVESSLSHLFFKYNLHWSWDRYRFPITHRICLLLSQYILFEDVYTNIYILYIYINNDIVNRIFDTTHVGYTLPGDIIMFTHHIFHLNMFEKSSWFIYRHL